VIPCHYASFGMIDQTAEKFAAGMDGSGIDVVLPKIGEARDI
jgi:L-ascorbate metabolism protein UlaG (beta-lactamase superfamily)